MGKFEDHIKQAAEQYTVDYNPDHWKRIEKNLASPKKSNSWKLVAGLALLAMASTYFLLPDKEVIPSGIKQQEQKPQAESTNEKAAPIKEAKTTLEPAAKQPATTALKTEKNTYPRN